jgi:hypothetical protein
VTRTQRQIEAFRQGDAWVQVRDASGRPCAGVPVSVEQESHEFLFGCVVPDLTTFSDEQRPRYRARLDEASNRLVLAEPTPLEPGVLRVDAPERVHLGLLRLRLDRLAASGLPLHVHVWGETVGMTEAGASGDAERGFGRRVAELYTLCFSHPSVGGVFWNGFVDGGPGARGGGLLRRDLAPRYAHKALQKLIGTVWRSRARGKTDADGRFGFRGFFGDYRVVADVGGPSAWVDAFALRRGGPGRAAPFLLRPPSIPPATSPSAP